MQGKAIGNMVKQKNVLLEIRGLKQYFPIKKSFLSRSENQCVKAVDDISMNIYEGETLGLVGESGCGKSTFGRTILQLYRPTEGDCIYYGRELHLRDLKQMAEQQLASETGVFLNRLNEKELRALRKDMQLIFQDPYSSLNPRMTIGQIVREGVRLHGIRKGKDEIENYVKEILAQCGINAEMLYRYPHQFSGGQRQRVCIARSLALQPKFIICDEAVSALDVSIQAQILNLLMDLQETKNLTYLFISHDLSVVRSISDRIGVMYLGKLMELAESDELFRHPLHPYTQALLDAVPRMEEMRSGKKIELSSDLPSPVNPPSGCRFHTRCPYATKLCEAEEPTWDGYGENHYVACHYAGKV